MRGATKAFRQLGRMNPTVRLLDSQRVFKGRVFDVLSDRLEYADGSLHRVDVVEHAASLGVIATPTPGQVVLVRQYRHPVRAALWEIPAGVAEPGEDPLDGARRELREETGFTAGRLTKIGSFWTTPGFCSEVMHIFHAEQLVAGEPSFDDDERIEIGTFTLQAAWRLVADSVADAKTALALYWLQGSAAEIGSVPCR